MEAADYNGRMVGKCQFSLASLFVATAFVALTSMAARNFVLGTDPFDRLVAWFVLPIFVCGVIGALRNQLRAWLSFSAAVVAGLVGVSVLGAFIRG